MIVNIKIRVQHGFYAAVNMKEDSNHKDTKLHVDLKIETSYIESSN